MRLHHNIILELRVNLYLFSDDIEGVLADNADLLMVEDDLLAVYPHVLVLEEVVPPILCLL